MKKLTYSEKLKDPRWQKKRLELLEASGWRCQFCGNDKKQLQVHHQFYIRNANPWEYDDFCYKVLCETCHESAQEKLEIAHALLAKHDLIEQIAALEDASQEDMLAFEKILYIAYEVPVLRGAKLKSISALCSSLDVAFQLGLSVK